MEGIIAALKKARELAQQVDDYLHEKFGQLDAFAHAKLEALDALIARLEGGFASAAEADEWVASAESELRAFAA